MASTMMTEALNMVNRTNVGSPDKEPVTYKILIIFLCVILNTIVLVVIRHQHELQEYMRILYQCLAVSDMFLGISWNLWVILWFSVKKTQNACAAISLAFPFVYNVSLISVMAFLCGICSICISSSQDRCAITQLWPKLDFISL